MAANIFDDDEAETVKHLDDLGGGRLYVNAAAPGAQMSRVSHMTIRILNQRNARLVLCPVPLITPDADFLELPQSSCWKPSAQQRRSS